MDSLRLMLRHGHLWLPSDASADPAGLGSRRQPGAGPWAAEHIRRGRPEHQPVLREEWTHGGAVSAAPPA
jgi:hypothetical protein